jgi:hypothetical protein
MTLLTDKEISILENRLSRESNAEKRNEITQLYKQYKVFIANEAMNKLILPKLKQYACKKFSI